MLDGCWTDAGRMKGWSEDPSGGGAAPWPDIDTGITVPRRTLRSSASPSVQQCPRIARLGARAVPPRARPTLPPRRAKPCCNPCKEAGPPVSPRPPECVHAADRGGKGACTLGPRAKPFRTGSRGPRWTPAWSASRAPRENAVLLADWAGRQVQARSQALASEALRAAPQRSRRADPPWQPEASFCSAPCRPHGLGPPARHR